MINIFQDMLDCVTQFIGNIIHPAAPGIDCSTWVPPEEFYPGGVWPDGSPIEPGAQCGVERW